MTVLVQSMSGGTHPSPWSMQQLSLLLLHPSVPPLLLLMLEIVKQLGFE